LILLSAELPVVNGFRICNRVKKDPNVGDVPLFLMGSAHDELATHGRLPTRADDYFTKPLAFDELAARIRLLGPDHGPAEHTAITQTSVDLSLSAVTELQHRLGEQEALISTLHRELASLRANATLSEAQAQEVTRLRAALEDARRLASMRPPQTARADSARL